MPDKDFSDCHKAYVHFSEAWYYRPGMRGPDIVDEVWFGYKGGSTAGEMTISYINIGPYITPRLEAHDDGWAALATFKDVIDAMAEVDSQRITPRQFCALLDRCGFVDETPRQDPDA